MKILFHNVKDDEFIFSNDFIFLCFQCFIWFYDAFFHVDLIFKNVKKHKYVYHIIWNMKKKITWIYIHVKNTCYLMYDILHINMLHLVIIHESIYLTFMKLSMHFIKKMYGTHYYYFKCKFVEVNMWIFFVLIEINIFCFWDLSISILLTSQ